MYPKLITINLFFICANLLQAQIIPNYSFIADSCYESKSYAIAGSYYTKAATFAECSIFIGNSYYMAGCCYSLCNQFDSAFLYLNKAVNEGYNFKTQYDNNNDLEKIKKDKRWLDLSLKLRTNVVSSDSLDIKIVTSDIDNFWAAYALAEKDSIQQFDIYKKYYFENGSAGLKDYTVMKIHSINAFVNYHNKRKIFYGAIKNNTLKIDSMKPQIVESFKSLKEIYPQAQFPPVYFVIGRFRSAGTSSPNGLLLGADMLSKSDDIPTGELDLWEKNFYSPLANIPYIVAHELIHFQQDELKQDTTTLSYAISEGMADFIGELISGKNANERIFLWAKGREKEIWKRFKEDMYYDRYDNWIANSNMERPDFPADQGYWVGYQICKSYYEETDDKKQAIYDMLHIKNYKNFLDKSKWEKKVEKL